jgi:lysophospholipase L1-like esterase
MLATLYADLADEIGCGFFDAGSVAQTTPLDGVHLDAANTRAIGKGIEPVVRMMLGI